MDDHRNLRRLVRRTLLAGVAGTLVIGLAGASASAQEFPSETIEVISHASAGGGTDTTARMMMEGTSEALGVDMVVVYKQGGGARAAHEYFAERPADGHTIMAVTQTHLYQIAGGQSPIGMDDIKGIARAMDDPSLIVVGVSSDIQDYEGLIAASKEEPLTWGVSVIGSTEHIGLARWAEAAGIEYRVVPFGGGGDMMTALRSGATVASVANVSESLSLIEEGEVRPIAVLDEVRLEQLPDIPTSFEKGHEVKVTTTRGYGVRADTPPELIAVLEEAMLEGMQTPEFQEYLKNSGVDPERSIGGSEEWDAQLKEEYATSKEVMERLGLVK
jgi:putative tricarboxylic transport membrane protein